MNLYVRRITTIAFAGFLFFQVPLWASSQNGLSNPEIQSEVKEVTEFPLRITCPKCGYVFYFLTMPELFNGEQMDLTQWFPGNSRIGSNPLTANLSCPRDQYVPYISIPLPQSSLTLAQKEWAKTHHKVATVTMWHTNKGWMPKRSRPDFNKTQKVQK